MLSLVGVVLVVTCEAVSHHREVSLQESLTQVEVVVLSVANSDKGANYVDERCVFWSVFRRTRVSAGVSISVLGAHTHSRGILAKVGLLVAAEESLGLGLGGSAARQLLVEAHDLLHADSVRG